MGAVSVTVRDMREDEYQAYAAARDAEYIASLSGALPPAVAREKARQDRARFLPQGLATARHRLLVVEDATGRMVGTAWLGLDEPGTGTPDVAWLYDITVVPAYRRRGYATAILGAVEEIARQAGAVRLGLNVFGASTPAIALYRSCGYEVVTQQMGKAL